MIAANETQPQPGSDVERLREIVRIALDCCRGEDLAWDRWAALWLALEAPASDSRAEVVVAAARAFRRASELFMPPGDPAIRRAEARERTVSLVLAPGNDAIPVEALLFEIVANGYGSRGRTLPESRGKP